MTYFFKYPFASSGTRTSIDTTNATPDGPVSYQYGFGIDYQLVLGTDVNALPINRGQSNQLYFDITDNLNQYQTQGVPNWITSVDNGGTPYSYDIYAVVRYDAGGGTLVYENQIQDNTSTPGDDDTWLPIQGGGGPPTGSVIDFAGISLPFGYLACDGSTVSRSTYSLLFSALTSTQSVTLTATSPTFTVSSAFGLYLGMKIESTGFASGTTISNISGTTITASNNATSSGSTQVTFFQWGNGNGTTTFTLPDFRRRVLVGQGGSGTSTIGSSIGQTGGTETVTLTVDQMPSHNHPGSTYGNRSTNPGGSISSYGSSALPNQDLSVNVAPQGGGQPHNNIQPSAVVYKIIKYI